MTGDWLGSNPPKRMHAENRRECILSRQWHIVNAGVWTQQTGCGTSDSLLFKCNHGNRDQKLKIREVEL